MRETNFIKQNKEKWQAFERLLEHDEKDPDKLNDLFIQITDDLSYSRTYYPNRSVRVYLNNLAQQVFYSIYKNKRLRGGRLWHFWTDELPQLVYEARPAFRLSLVVFVLSMLIGMLSSYMNPEFPRVILGDSYVDMTIENINSGDPMAVYKEKGEFGMSFGITANNLFVAFLTFGLGIFFGIGSAGVLISNGVMVGAFQYFFIEKELFQESFLTIWTHGTLEISAIVIAGAAGITMGRGLAFPGTLSRLQAFQISARRGMKIMFGIAPIIILAGFIEGYLTRYTETPDIIRLLFILICLAFILGYFVWYPIYKARQGFAEPVKDTTLPPDNLQELSLDRIKTSGEIFSDIFLLYKKIINQVILISIAAALLFCVATLLMAPEDISNVFQHPNQFFGAISVMDQYFHNESIPFLLVPTIFIYSLVTYVPLMYLARYAEAERYQKAPWHKSLFAYGKMLIPIGLVVWIVSTGSWYTLLLILFVAPILFLWAFVSYYENINILKGISRTFNLLSGNFSHLFGLFVLLVLVNLLFYGFLDTFLLWFFIDMIGWNISADQSTMDAVFTLLLAFTSVFFISLLFTIMSLGAGILYFSLLEIEDAPSLKARIRRIGQRRRIQGIEAEG